MAKSDDSFEQRFPLRRAPAEPAEPARVRPAARTIKQPVFEVAPPPPPPPSTAKRLSEAARNWFEPFEPLELTGGMPPPQERGRGRGFPPPPLELSPAMAGGYTTNLPVVMRPNRWKWFWRGLAVLIVLFIAAVAWLALTAPLSKSLQPIAPPSITLLAADGKTAIARRGAVIGAPVDAAKLPGYVGKAFMAIEDRRFETHWGVDPRGIVRAFVHNISGSGGSQGGSTITQQLAKNAFLTADRTAARKFQEVLIAFWLEAWLTKDEILSRYLSNVYFGDNVYGLRAASQHYFSCKPEDLTISQATLLAGLVQAPSRLAPTGNLQGARDRQKLVIAAMADAGFITKTEAAAVRPAVLKTDHVRQLPNGTYFADWVLPQARDSAGEIVTDKPVTTTLEMPVQKAAERAARLVGGRMQVAIVAMHPDGRVIAMVGGKAYSGSPFNRATQARRQPGSAFKLFVYLAAMKHLGMTPDTMVDDSPVSFGGWSPENSHRDYEGPIKLQRAFAKSSNVVAARLIQQLGVARVTQTARDLGISTPIGDNASIALGSSTVSLLELTSAYASIAAGHYPVRPQGLGAQETQTDWLGRMLAAPTPFPDRTLRDMRTLLKEVTDSGTGRSARLPIDTFGKTGTTQDNRDALFVGYAGEGDDAIVAGVWMGNDDNSPSPGLSGAGLPSRVWREFMMHALKNLPAPPPPTPVDEGNSTEGNGTALDQLLDGLGVDKGEIHTQVDGFGDGGDDDGPPPPDNRRREDAIVPQRPGVETRVDRPAPNRPRPDAGNPGN
jgi:penicillin-binding protein 1A